jgi:hypothetical protein
VLFCFLSRRPSAKRHAIPRGLSSAIQWADTASVIASVRLREAADSLS